MSLLVAAINHKTSVRLAEVGFLLILIAGVWLVATEIPKLRLHTVRMVFAGILLAVAGLLLIIAAHSGKLFG